jgi:hypothetical protein
MPGMETQLLQSWIVFSTLPVGLMSIDGCLPVFTSYIDQKLVITQQNAKRNQKFYSPFKNFGNCFYFLDSRSVL